MYNWVTLLYSRDWHNTVNQLYFNKKIFKRNKNKHRKISFRCFFVCFFFVFFASSVPLLGLSISWLSLSILSFISNVIILSAFKCLSDNSNISLISVSAFINCLFSVWCLTGSGYEIEEVGIWTFSHYGRTFQILSCWLSLILLWWGGEILPVGDWSPSSFLGLC